MYIDEVREDITISLLLEMVNVKDVPQLWILAINY